MSASTQSAKSCLYRAGIILLGITILGTVLPFVAFLVIRVVEQNQAAQRAKFEQPFLNEMPGYTGVFRPAANHIVLQGKILVINPSEYKVDPIQYELPRQYQAQRPAEVNVLVWLECRVLENMAFGGLNTFFTIDLETCKLTVIDWATKSIVSRTEFMGKRPDDKIQASNSESVRITLQKEASVDRNTIEKWLLAQMK